MKDETGNLIKAEEKDTPNRERYEAMEEYEREREPEGNSRKKKEKYESTREKPRRRKQG